MTVKIVIKQSAVIELLKSPRVQAELKARADRIASTANAEAGLSNGFLSEVGTGKTRARARVFTATADAMVAEARDRTLTRSFDAGR